MKPSLWFLWMLVRLCSSVVGKLYNVSVFSILDQCFPTFLPCDPVKQDPSSDYSEAVRVIYLLFP